MASSEEWVMTFCSLCGDPVVEHALVYSERYGTNRCGGTHCKNSDSRLMRALRALPSAPPGPVASRVALLERTLRAHGIEVPP